MSENDSDDHMKCVAAGLTQLPLEGLERIKKHMDVGRKVLMKGTIVDNDHGKGPCWY